jgi:uncharacterized protein Veg
MKWKRYTESKKSNDSELVPGTKVQIIANRGTRSEVKIAGVIQEVDGDTYIITTGGKNGLKKYVVSWTFDHGHWVGDAENRHWHQDPPEKWENHKTVMAADEEEAIEKTVGDARAIWGDKPSVNAKEVK